jgi:hypothetical protein
MLRNKKNIIILRLTIITFVLGASILLCKSDFILQSLQAQQEVKKEYVRILPEAVLGAAPGIKVSPLTFDAQRKEGAIPLEILPAGFWKSTETLAGTGYELFEFEIEAPSHTMEVGEPNVPTQNIEVDIPPGAELDKVEITPELLKTVEDVNLVPNQEPLPIGQEELIFEKQKVTINNELYKQETAYPGKYYEVITTGYFGARKIVILKMFPVQFYPATKKVEFYRLSGKVTFKAEKITKIEERRDVLGAEERGAGLSAYNIEDAQKWEPFEREISPELIKEFESMDSYQKIKEMKEGLKKGEILTIPCVIICADLFYCPARDLAAHHTKKGIYSIAVRAKSIIDCISGLDDPDRIRNYIKILYKSYKTKWVILFGDVCTDPCKVTIVPTRLVVDPSPYNNIDDGWIPCDYYYACLDGTWDSNNNKKYGEIADKPDLLPEVYVGRIPTNDLDDAYRVVNSIIKYETSPPAKKGALLAANDLGWGCHEITFKEQTYLPLVKGCPFPAIYRLYQKWNNLTVSTFANQVNKGIDFIEYYGHGSPSSTQLMSMSQVKSVINTTTSMPVLFALSCSTARYDCQECFGEAWLEYIKASAYIGSTRVAYGGLDSGEGLDIRFIKNYCGIWRTGAALDIAKYQLFKDYGWSTYTIKTILEFTLFGDPVMNHVH